MDAGNQSAAVRFLHRAAANLSSIETNAPDFTPTPPQLLLGNNPLRFEVRFYCPVIGLTEHSSGRGPARAGVEEAAVSRVRAVCGAVA